jgi:chromosome segregation ATPase
MSKVVIVDADASFTESVTELFTPLGLTPVVTADGDGALDLVKQQRPALLILSVELAKGSGFSLCNRLKRHADLGSIPIILLSAQASPEALAQHQKLPTHADAYLMKPFQLDELLAKAKQVAPQAFGAKGEGAPGGGDGFEPEAVLAVEEDGAGKGQPGVDAALDAAFGSDEGGAAPRSSGSPLSSSRNTGMFSRPGRSARGPSLDELLARARPDEPAPSLPPTAGPEAKQQFLRDTLRRRESDLTRARELWAAREREVQALEDALDQRTRELDQHKDDLRDALVRLSASDERGAAASAEGAILEERVQRLDREKEALLQEAEATREAHEREAQAAEERYASLEQQKLREREEMESTVAERDQQIGALNRRLDDQRAAAAQEAAEAHDREMALTRDRDQLQSQLDEALGTNEGLQALVKQETEARVRAEGGLADIRKAKEDSDRAAERAQTELTQKFNAVSRERQELETERENNLAELAQRADQIARLETRIADLEAEVIAHSGRATDLEREVYDRDRQIEELNTELQSRAARIQMLEDELQRAKDRGAQLEQRLNEARAAAEKAAKERSETERSLRDQIAQMDGTIKERDLRIQTLESDADRLQGALESSRAERDSFAERLGERDAELAEEQRNHTQTRTSLESALAKEKKASAEQKASADRRDADQQGRILQLETDLSATSEQLRQTESELSGTKAKLTEVDRSLRSTKATLDETAAEREQLRGQVQDFMGQLRRKAEYEQRLSADLSSAQGRIDTLEHEVESLREQHGLEKGELDAARSRLEEKARAKIGELNDHLAEARNQIEDFKNQVEGFQVHSQALENELLALRAERDSEARNRGEAEGRLDALTRSLTEEKDKREKGERERLALKKGQDKAERLREQLQQDLAAAEARHKVELDSLRSELRVKDRSISELQEAQAREKAAREREKQGLNRTLEDEKRSLSSKVDELTRRLERAEQRATGAEAEANKERTARVRERAAAKVAQDSMQTRLDALEGQVAQGGGSAVQAQMEKAIKEQEERIEDMESELSMITATLQDASNKNKRLQEELARKTVGGAEAAELRRKYNELVARYKQREEERKKLSDDYQKAMEQLQRAKTGPKPAPRAT